MEKKEKRKNRKKIAKRVALSVEELKYSKRNSRKLYRIEIGCVDCHAVERTVAHLWEIDKEFIVKCSRCGSPFVRILNARKVICKCGSHMTEPHCRKCGVDITGSYFKSIEHW